MNWFALAPVLIKHWPLLSAIVQRDGPEVQAFFADCAKALQQTQQTTTTGPVLDGPNFKFEPQHPDFKS